jgi:putative tryptophan/tyrosine transport system substrate-binding protein
VEGQNLILERRSAEGRFERFGDIVAELVRLKTDVIVGGWMARKSTDEDLAKALVEATQTIEVCDFVLENGGSVNWAFGTAYALPWDLIVLPCLASGRSSRS